MRQENFYELPEKDQKQIIQELKQVRAAIAQYKDSNLFTVKFKIAVGLCFDEIVAMRRTRAK